VLAASATIDPGPELMKPFLEMTGPEKVVFAIIVISCIAVKFCSLYTV